LDIIKDPANIVAIEWPEKIAKLLPRGLVKITFGHLKESEREITIDGL
jgi:tRNA A37 threonylcarbamoyladenosine biosynthesis protein TsaE